MPAHSNQTLERAKISVKSTRVHNNCWFQPVAEINLHDPILIFCPSYSTGYKFVDDGIDGMFFLFRGICASGKFVLSTSCAGRFSTWLLTRPKRLSAQDRAHFIGSSSSSSPVMVTNRTQSASQMNLNS